MAIKLAKNPRPQAADLRWDALFRGRRQDVPAPEPVLVIGSAPIPVAIVEAALPGPSDSAPPDGPMTAPIIAEAPAGHPAATAGVPEESIPATPPPRRRAAAQAVAEPALATTAAAPTEEPRKPAAKRSRKK
jgi:hypothetical protein